MAGHAASFDAPRLRTAAGHKALCGTAPWLAPQVLTEVLREAQLPGSRPAPTDAQAAVPAGAAYRMDENLTLFCDVVGGCERLLKTPIPLQYTR